MIKLSFFIIMCFFLTGCPGKGEGLEIGQWRAILVDDRRVCFSLNKEDVLSAWYLESNENNGSTILLSSEHQTVSMTYPATCISISLKKGYQYGTTYTLNGVNYHYEFFIDNNWNVVNRRF